MSGKAEDFGLQKYQLESPIVHRTDDDFGTLPWKTLTSLPVDMDIASQL